MFSLYIGRDVAAGPDMRRRGPTPNIRAPHRALGLNAKRWGLSRNARDDIFSKIRIYFITLYIYNDLIS